MRARTRGRNGKPTCRMYALAPVGVRSIFIVLQFPFLIGLHLGGKKKKVHAMTFRDQMNVHGESLASIINTNF